MADYWLIRYVKLLVTILLVFALVACTNSRWFLSTLYNRVDNRLYSEALGYADFDEVQRDQIKFLVNRFHHWHRTTQVPKYAGFLNRLSVRAYSGQSISLKEIELWADEIQGFFHDVTACHPLITGTDILSSLSNEQVQQIVVRARQTYDEQWQAFHKKGAQERFDKRYKNILKWFDRFQLSIDAAIEQDLKETMHSEPLLREASFELWADWDQRFHQLLLKRKDVEFAEQVKGHVMTLNTMVEESYPEEVSIKLKLWVQFFYRLAQKELAVKEYGFAGWSERMSENLLAISESVPDKQMHWSANDYCAN